MKQQQQQITIEEVQNNDVNTRKSQQLENMESIQSQKSESAQETTWMVKNKNDHNNKNDNNNNSNNTSHSEVRATNKTPTRSPLPNEPSRLKNDFEITNYDTNHIEDEQSPNEPLRLRLTMEDDSDSDCIAIDLDDDIERITPTAPPMSLLLDDELDYKHHEVETIIEEDDDSSDCEENNNNNINNFHCNNDNNNNNNSKVKPDHNERSKDSSFQNIIIEADSKNLDEVKSLTKDSFDTRIIVDKASKENQKEPLSNESVDVENNIEKPDENEALEKEQNYEIKMVLVESENFHYNIEKKEKQNEEDGQEKIIEKDSESCVLSSKRNTEENNKDNNEKTEIKNTTISNDDISIRKVRSLTGPCPCSDDDEDIIENEDETDVSPIPLNAGRLHLQISYKHNKFHHESEIKKNTKIKKEMKTLSLIINDIEGIPSESHGGAKKINIHASLMITASRSSSKKNKKLKVKTEMRLASKGLHNEQLFNYHNGGLVMVEKDHSCWLRVRLYGKYGVQTKMVGEVTLDVTPLSLEEDSTGLVSKSLESTGEVVTFHLSKYLEPRGKVVSNLSRPLLKLYTLLVKIPRKHSHLENIGAGGHFSKMIFSLLHHIFFFI